MRIQSTRRDLKLPRPWDPGLLIGITNPPPPLADKGRELLGLTVRPDRMLLVTVGIKLTPLPMFSLPKPPYPNLLRTAGVSEARASENDLWWRVSLKNSGTLADARNQTMMEKRATSCGTHWQMVCHICRSELYNGECVMFGFVHCPEWLL